MDLENWFFPDKRPGQILYLGEERSLLLTRTNGGKWQEAAAFPHSLGDLSAFSSLPGARQGPLGISINPNPFVFNLFNFEAPLPFNQKKRTELIEWRLQRVFPDASDDMRKTSLVFNRKTVLSTLIPGALLRSCEEHFNGLGYPVSYISCSSVDAVRKSSSRSTEALMILEQEGSLLMVTLVKGGIPIFMRKIRFSQLDELLLALSKTLAFVREQQGVTVAYYVVSPLGGGDSRAWLEQLEELKPAPPPRSGDRLALFLP